MLRNRNTLLGVVLVIALLVVSSPSGAEAAMGRVRIQRSSSSLASVLIRLSDLRRGYRAGRSCACASDPVANGYGVPAAPYDASRAIASSMRSFHFPGFPNWVDVDNTISLFPSPAAAQRVFGYYASRGGVSIGIGNQSAAWEVDIHQPDWAYTVAYSLFRAGRYLVSVRVFALLHSFSSRNAADLARVVARRMGA